jgi:dynein heavy chain 2
MLDPSFIQSINSILSSGDLPGLFSPQEFDSFAVQLRDEAAQENFQSGVHSFFASSERDVVNISANRV